LTTWIFPRELIDGTGADPRRDVAVGIEDDRIAHVVDRRAARVADDDAVVDEPELVLTPGLIDSHVHLVLDHGPDHATTRAGVEAASDAELTARAVRNAHMCLGAGITTVRDCGGRGLITSAVRDAIDAGLLVGPRVLACGPPLTTTAGHAHWLGGIADSEQELRVAVRELCRDRVDFIKVMATGGNMTAGSNPLRAQYGAAELASAAFEAHRLNRRIAAHVLSAEAIPWLVDAEYDTLEHCLWQAPEGGTRYDAELAARIAAGGTWVGVTLAGIDRLLLRDPAGGRQALRDRHADVRRLLDAGVRVMLSSDAGVRYTRFEDFALTLVCAVEGLGMSPVEAIHRATSVPADALGIAGDVGTVEGGKRADVVLVAGDPASEVGDMAAVRAVWRDGRVVVMGDRVAVPDPIPLEIGDDGRPGPTPQRPRVAA
jgi:imidazolonepropionase-like amidohydrolase